MFLVMIVLWTQHFLLDNFFRACKMCTNYQERVRGQVAQQQEEEEENLNRTEPWRHLLRQEEVLLLRQEGEALQGPGVLLLPG